MEITDGAIAMTPKQELLKELETVPSPVIKEVLNFLRFLKTKQSPLDFMDFAGMASDDPALIDDIVGHSDAGRAIDFERIQDLWRKQLLILPVKFTAT